MIMQCFINNFFFEKDMFCIPSVMVEVRYAGVEQAAVYWGESGNGSCGHLRIDIHESNHNSWKVEYVDL